jgi:hypothetical protein
MSATGKKDASYAATSREIRMNEWTREPDSCLQEQGGMSRLLRLNHTWYACTYVGTYCTCMIPGVGMRDIIGKLEGVIEWSKLFFMGMSPCACVSASERQIKNQPGRAETIAVGFP